MTSNLDGLSESSVSNFTLQGEYSTSFHRRPNPIPTEMSTDPASSAVKTEGEEDNDDNDNNDSMVETDDESQRSEDEQDYNLTRRGIESKPYTSAEERTVLRKLDRRLTLFLCLLYLLSFLDRSNIGNARVAGLQSSLGITDAQFDLTLLAFYVTYITFEWMILLYRLVPPHVYIASCVFAWGLVACLQSAVTSFAQLLALRATLGVTEAAFGPGVPFYMTFFYRREELAYRVGLQISAAPLATSFASSLAWVIVKLSERSPLESWRALFLFEGFPSLIAAVFAYYIIPDSPSTAYWLTPRERKIAALRLHNSASSSSPSSHRASATSASKLNTSDLLKTLTDPKAYLTSLMFLSVNVSFSSLPVFLPTIINDMSFSPLTSQILAAPPYLVAFVFVLLVSRASDRIPDSRGLFLMGCAGLSCASYASIALVGALSSRGLIGDRLSIVLRYVAIYPAACGLFASVVLIITWQLNNQASETGKGVGMVILNVVGQCGPLVGVRLFPASGAPWFVGGMAVCAGFMGGVVGLGWGLRAWLGRLNRSGEEKGRGRGRYEMAVLGSAEGGEDEVQGLVSGDVDVDIGGGRRRRRGRKRRKGENDGLVFRYML